MSQHAYLNSSAYATFVLSMAKYDEVLAIITISSPELTQVLKVETAIPAAFASFCAIAEAALGTKAYEFFQAGEMSVSSNVGVFAIMLPADMRLQLNFLVSEVSQ